MTVVKVNGLRTPEQRAGVCYVGRAFAGWRNTIWGNYGRLACPDEFRDDFVGVHRYHETLYALWLACDKGAKPLGCWCLDWDGTGPTPACHAAVLAEQLNQEFADEIAAEGSAP